MKYLVQIEFIAQTLKLGEKFREAYFPTRRNIKRGLCNKCEKLTSKRSNNYLWKFK